MGTATNNQWATLLAGLGFVPEGRQTWTHWRLVLPEKPETAPKPSNRFANPWRLKKFSLAERRGSLAVHHLELELDRAILTANLSALARKHFSARVVMDIVWGANAEIWCIGEFARLGVRSRKKAVVAPSSASGSTPTEPGDAGNDDQAPKDEPPSSAQRAKDHDAAIYALPPQGVGGFNWRFYANGTGAGAMVADFFACGYVPLALASAPLRYIGEALGLRLLANTCGFHFAPVSMHELRFPLHACALIALADHVGGSAPSQALTALGNALSKGRTPASLLPLVAPTASGLLIATTGAEDATLTGPLGLSEVGYAPVEVLESRERFERFGDTDRLILAGRYNKAVKLVQAKLAEDSGNLYLLRRQALLNIVDRTAAKSSAGANQASPFDQALTAEPGNLLFLSAALRDALRERSQPRILQHLSSLGAEIMRKIPQAESIARFDEVMPEMLGDAWAIENRTKAEECYQRVIQRRGDLPRVLRKLVSLANSQEQADLEAHYLSRLAQVERRQTEQAKISYRLAELRSTHATGKDEAVQLALKALKLDRAHDRAALLAANLLVEKGRCEEAIQLLDSLLRAAPSGLTQVAMSRVELMIGRIWHHRLGRPDLAETRYNKAAEYDAENFSSLKELEVVYRLSGNARGLARTLGAQFDFHERHGNGEALKPLFDELASLFRGPLAQPKRALELYQRLLAGSTSEPLEIDRVLAWNDIDIDWRDLYGRLQGMTARVTAGEQRAQFYCRLAEISRDKLNDSPRALRHLRDALAEGWIDSANFRFLVDTLAQGKDFTVLCQAYRQRLAQVPVSDRRPLLIELLAVPEGLTDQERDALAVEANKLDPSNDRTVQQRFYAYQALDEVGSIERLLAMILAEKSLSQHQRQEWLRLAVEMLLGCGDEKRFAAIDAAHRELLRITEDRLAVLQEGVAALKNGPDQRRLIFYVSELLAADVLPALEERQVIKLLQGLDSELALYHQLMSFKTTVPEMAAMHARTAAALYAKRANQEFHTERMLARICTLVPCSPDDLSQLLDLVTRTGNWHLLARALQKQADFEDERHRKFALLDQLGTLYWKKLKDHARARLTFVLAMKHSASPGRLKLTLAEIAAETGDVAHERKALTDFLADPAAPGDLEAMKKSVQRLLGLGETGAVIMRVVQPHIDQAVSKGDWQHTLRLASVLLDHQVATSDLYKTAFRAAIICRQVERAVDLWWRGMACVPNKSKAKAYMADTARILKVEGRQPPSEILISCYKAAVDHNVGNRLGPKIHHELLLQYGALLFDSDTKRRRALSVFIEASRMEPDDNRSWMPLYFLLLEFGTPSERFAHLREILPRLKDDPRPLKSYPLTVESLEVELNELEEQLGPSLPPAQSTDRPLPELESAKWVSHTPESDDSLAGHALPELPKDAPSAKIHPIAMARQKPSEAPKAPAAPHIQEDYKQVSGDGPGGVLPLSTPSLRATPPQPTPFVAPFNTGSQGHAGAAADGDKSISAAAFAAGKMENSDSHNLFVVPPPPVLPAPNHARSQSWPDLPAAVDLGPIAELNLDFGDPKPPEQIAATQPPPMPAVKVASFSLDEVGKDAEFDLHAPLPGLTPADLPPPAIPLNPAPVEGAAVMLADEAPVMDLIRIDANDKYNDQNQDQVQEAPPNLDSADDELDLGLNPNLGDDASKDGMAIKLLDFSGGEAPPPGADKSSGIPLPAFTVAPASDGPLPSAPDVSDSTQIMASPDPHAFALGGPSPSTSTNLGEDLNIGAGGEGGDFGLPSEPAEDIGNWRAAVIKGDFNADLTPQLMRQAFASEIEKHLAIQCVALVAGNCDCLGNWHWRVWRHPEEYGYALSGRERFPPGSNPPALHSNLHKFVIAAAPLMVRVWRDRFSTASLASQLSVAPSAIAKLAKPLSWTEGLLKNAGFAHYADRLANRRFLIFNLPGIGKNIFYDGRSRALYLDEGHYRNAPNSHLFHRLLGIIWSVNIHYYVPLALNAREEFMPFFIELSRLLGASGFRRLKSHLASRSSLSRNIAGLDIRPLRTHLEKLGQTTEEQVVNLWDAMRVHVYRLLLAETLDVVGLCESILDKDLLQKDALKHSEVYQLDKDLKPLIEFATKLRI